VIDRILVFDPEEGQKSEGEQKKMPGFDGAFYQI
jgi:hypothetical protein